VAVEIDNPEDAIESLKRGFGDGLPDGALVELGVTDETDEAALAVGAGKTVA